MKPLDTDSKRVHRDGILNDLQMCITACVEPKASNQENFKMSMYSQQYIQIRQIYSLVKLASTRPNGTGRWRLSTERENREILQCSLVSVCVHLVLQSEFKSCQQKQPAVEIPNHKPSETSGATKTTVHQKC